MKSISPQKSKLLLVEDEEPLAIGLEYNLTAEGYQVVWAKDGKNALELFEKETFDLIILDIMLPFLDGFQVALHIRAVSPQIPILVLSARGAIEDRTRGFELGVDDYLSKPFHLQELLLRIAGMLRRKAWYSAIIEKQPSQTVGKTIVNFETLECMAGKKQFRLTPHEAMILRYFIENSGRILSRKELLENVWNISSDVDTRTVDNFIVRLRRYFEADPQQPVLFTSVRGAGYLYNPS
ncbi:MAG: DNA-binding response regulator [Calditrichaeota bacterium]|nr:MAG: DNA-binding response regulator [Calditrichota bacterium]